MNLTTGTGQIAWQPQRLSAEAYAFDPATISETLPSTDRSLNVLEGMFPYGPIGVCRAGGTCVLSKVPTGWIDNPYPRLLRFKLQSEHGTGYVYSAIVKEVKKDGKRALVDLISVQDKYAQRSLYTGGLLSYPGLVGAERYLGISPPSGLPPTTIRESAWNDRLAGALNSEWGVGPDMVGAAGIPEGGTPFEYTINSLAKDLASQGFVIPDYATEWIFDPGDGWDKTRGSRYPPPWTPERTVSASADPATIPQTFTLEATRDSSAIASVSGGGKTRSFANVIVADDEPRSYSEVDSTATELKSDAGLYTLIVPPDSTGQRNQKLTVQVPFKLLAPSGTPGSAPVIEVPPPPPPTTGIFSRPQLTSDSDTQAVKDRVNALQDDMNGVFDRAQQMYGAAYTVRGTPRSTDPTLVVALLQSGEVVASQVIPLTDAIYGIEQAAKFDIDQNLSGGATLQIRLELTTQDTRRLITLIFRPITGSLEAEVPNVGGIVVPREFYYPYFAGPTYQFSLRAWVAPPVRVLNLPGGQTQYLAQSEVHWTSKGAMSVLTTAAMRWRGTM